MSSSFWVIAAVLGVGLAYKLPAFLRGGRNPLARQVAGLLLAACAVFFFAAPTTIARVNDITGVPNVAGPVVYTLLTGFCASCLLLIVKWRGGTPASVRRATWLVHGSYGTVIVLLWVFFALGEHQVERTRDLDTYYATTPWMREMILLYLLGHTVAVLVTSALLWSWESRVRGRRWLHLGVVLLSVGYALNLVFDGVKLVAVVARWGGHDLDWLSTTAAPPVAGVAGLVIALGFILPHAGEHASHQLADRREYRDLRPLADALRGVRSAASPVPMGRFTRRGVRLTQRRTAIRDALRQLEPHLDPTVLESAVRGHLADGKTHEEARVLAEAEAVVAAAALVAVGRTTGRAAPGAALTSTPLTLSRILRRHPDLDAARRNRTPEGRVAS
ncbi:MAB_1171c family putative transporter [Streptomyces sp. NPDC101249]|uniref:MAB_1171c family putative transporter n=1 Tax=Streptomyces sp. NPDC101249 TaxID=3366140 RepID=UPI0037FEA3CA